jgi:hypothetical protein
VPDRARGYLFEYELVNVLRGFATVKYTDRIIKPSGTSFEIYKETEETQTMQYRTQDIEKSHELWQQANGRVNASLYHQKQALIRATKATPVVIDLDAIDLSDIDAFFTEKGRGPHFLEMEFEPAEPEPEQYTNEKGEEFKKWLWKHRLTGRSFYRHQSASGNSFDSGRLSKFLESIKKRDNPVAYARAQHILTLNKLHKQVLTNANVNPVVPLDRRQVLHQQVRFYSSPAISLSCNNVLTTFYFVFSLDLSRSSQLCLPSRLTLQQLHYMVRWRSSSSSTWIHHTSLPKILHS